VYHETICVDNSNRACYSLIVPDKQPFLHVRMSAKEQAGFNMAAEIAGLSLSSWVRIGLRDKAVKELSAAGRRAPFVIGKSVAAKG